MNPLRIGVNALYLIPGGVGGTEIYLRHLLSALAEIDTENEYIVFTNRETGADFIPARFRAAPQNVRAAVRPWRIAWEQAILPLQIRGQKLDVLLNPGFTAPLAAGCPQVTVFHDLQHKRHPEHFRWFDLPFWRVLLYGSARFSRILLADSEETRKDLLRYYPIHPEKVRLAPLGVDPEFFRLDRRPERYLLAVSTLHPHKNLDNLLRVFAHFRAETPGFRLIIAGFRGFSTERLESLRGDLGLEEEVEFTGWIPRKSLYGLFARAWAFIYPSRFEGFGLPVLEAMAAGIPVACSRIQPLTDICGDAAMLFDPGSEQEMLDALRSVTHSPEIRRELSVAGPRRAAQFSWRKTAELTRAALLDAARQG